MGNFNGILLFALTTVTFVSVFIGTLGALLFVNIFIKLVNSIKNEIPIDTAEIMVEAYIAMMVILLSAAIMILF